MRFKNTEETYGLVSQILHWAIALIIISLFALGLFMHEMGDSPEKWELYGLHKSFGIVVINLAILRLMWFLYSKRPKPEASLSKKEISISKALHALLYVLMLAIPLSGWLMSSAGGHLVNVFGLIELPALVEKNKALSTIFNQAHEIGAYTIISLVVLHIAGALKHHFINKDGVLRRMLPFK